MSAPKRFHSIRGAMLADGERHPTYHMRATPEGARAAIRYLEEVCGFEVSLAVTRDTVPSVKIKPRRLRMGKIVRAL